MGGKVADISTAKIEKAITRPNQHNTTAIPQTCHVERSEEESAAILVAKSKHPYPTNSPNVLPK
jgi:hypothetical protein